MLKKLVFVLALLLPTTLEAYTGEEYCLAQNIWHEARGEVVDNDLSPWLAVAFVTVNRVESYRWPSNVCAVVWDDSQFSWTKDAYPDEILPQDDTEALLWEEILHFSSTFLDNYKYIIDPTGGANHYHSQTVNPEWNVAMIETGVIGNHIFYVD